MQGGGGGGTGAGGAAASATLALMKKATMIVKRRIGEAFQAERQSAPQWLILSRDRRYEIGHVEKIRDQPDQSSDNRVRQQFQQQPRARGRPRFAARHDLLRFILALHAKRQDREQKGPPDDEIKRQSQYPRHCRMIADPLRGHSGMRQR